MKSTIKRLFGKENDVLIGMIHLPPLLSIKGFPGMEEIIVNALADLRALEGAGFDGALIENDNDKPHTEFANSAQISSFAVVAKEVRDQAKIPIGVQMMLNDWKASFEIARAAGATFSRLDVFVDHVTCEWGEIKPAPNRIIAYKNKIHPDLLLLTDIQVKYKEMIRPRPLTVSAEIALRHKADGLVITGKATGVETPTDKLREIRKKLPHAPLFVGAGVNINNIREQMGIANGAIIGTSIKTKDRIDLIKARALRRALRVREK